MIEIVLGNIGSGKTASIVREIVQNKDVRTTFSNIITKGIKNNVLITEDMIIKQTPILNAKGEETGKFKEELNVEFWQEAVEKHNGINVVLDEAHTLVNSRRSMSKKNVIMSDFIALLRRVIGSSNGYGKLVLISQLKRRLDVIALEMATMVKFHVCHYTIECQKCKELYYENNETPEKIKYCPKCESPKLRQKEFVLEVWHFKNLDSYDKFDDYGVRTYHRHYFITDIENYFKNYNTLQWDSLLSNY